MKYVYLSILVLLALLSLAAGAAKCAHTDHELAFFEAAGIASVLLIPFGALQIVGGLMAFAPQTRIIGLWVMAAMFGLSALMILITGNFVFGLISLIPASIAFILIFWKPTVSTSAE